MEDTSLYQDDGMILVFHFNDSADCTDASPMDLLRPELSAFAERLEASGLFQSSADESSGSSIDLIGEFQTYAAEHVDAAAHAVEQLEDLGEEEDDGQCADELFEARELLKYWEMEHQTWELFGTLITHRIGTEGRIPEDIPPELDDKFASDVSIREYFFEADPTFRELTIVLQWLRRYAPGSTVDEIENDRLYRGDRGWMYTKEKIKATKRMRPGKQLSFKLMPASNQNIVTELDPDAPSRQRAQLEEEDGAWERYLMKLVWGFLRKGQFTIARDLCVDAGEFWRAASITGAKHVWDPKIDGSRDIEGLDDEEKLDEEDDDEYSVKGNRNRELWKRMCFAVARRQGGEIYEKAVYGILCGDVESVSFSFRPCHGN